MSEALAVFTSDPNLIRCELLRLQAHTSLGAGERANAAGLGCYAQDEVLLQRFSSGLSLLELTQQWSGPESEALLYHGQNLPLGLSLEENTQPFRFRRWLFAHVGKMEGFQSLRNRLLAYLPEFLRRQIRGDTDSEAVFALFLKLLRDTGRSESEDLEAPLVAQLLGKTVRTVEQLANEAGIPGKSTLNLVASNGRLLAAVRYGADPLFYSLLEGSSRCERCGLEGANPDSQLVREHRRARTVAVTTNVARSNGWIEVSKETALCADRGLNVQVLPI